MNQSTEQPADHIEDGTGDIPDVNPEDHTAADSFVFLESTDGTLTLTGYTGAESNLEIPAELEGKAVTAIGDGAFAGCGPLSRLHRSRILIEL